MPPAFSRKYYRSLDPLVTPPAWAGSWEKIFGRQAPLEFEIGFGNGEYLHRASLERPERDFVGAELAWASIKRALRRLAAPPRPNAKVMRLSADQALSRVFAPESLSVVRALFPIPWPEDKEAKKRLFTTAFLDLAASRLAPDGRFVLVTDSEILARWTMEQAAASALALDMSEGPAALNTKYERKWLGGGQDIFYTLSGGKTRQPEMEEPPVPMQAYFIERFDPENYRPQGREEMPVIKFRDFNYDPRKEEALLRAFVVEGALIQDFYIRIGRVEGRWKVGPAIAGQLFPTQGVDLALRLAAGLEG